MNIKITCIKLGQSTSLPNAPGRASPKPLHTWAFSWYTLREKEASVEITTQYYNFARAPFSLYFFSLNSIIKFIVDLFDFLSNIFMRIYLESVRLCFRRIKFIEAVRFQVNEVTHMLVHLFLYYKMKCSFILHIWLKPSFIIPAFL